MTNISSAKKRFVTLFGVLGYFSLVLQWLWAIIVFLPLLLQSGVKDLFLPNQTVHHTQSVAALGGPSLLWTVIGIIITFIIVGISILILVRLPLKIAKTGEKITHQAVDVVLPVITHHRALPAARKKRLTARLTKLIKFTACLLPMIILCGIFFIHSQLAPDIVALVGSVLAIGTLVWFSFEYLLARWFKLPPEEIL